MKLFIDSFQAIKALIDSVSDKLGAGTDVWDHPDKTVLGYANVTYKHIHNPGYVTPANGTVITVTTAIGGATFGDFADVIEADQINKAFDIHWLSITDIEANGVYVIELHKLDGTGDSEALLSQVVVTRADNFSKVGQVFVQIPVQPPNSRVGARVLSDAGTAKYVKFVAHYHDYE